MPYTLKKQKQYTKQAFFGVLFIASVMFLPFLIYDKGLFIFYGDFNVQQIPFYQMAHDAVRSGDIFWSWTTDLGANFIGSYSFYLLGSPFFWITLPFPNAAVPYLMAPLLILKLAFASLTAYLLLRRFVSTRAALLGAVLYAFSGYSVYNIFFNHFHEAVIYFPLMILGMELLMSEKRCGLFASAVFLSALSNFYFFIGQAIFLIIYWFVRALSGEWTRNRAAGFFHVLVEAVLGTALAAVLLVPAFYAVIQNGRTEQLLSGWDLLIYTKPQRFFDILHSFFFPQDIPARAAFFPDSQNKWGSMSAWLPLFGCTGMTAYLQTRKYNDWVKRMLVVCLFCAFIPGLNAMFQLFNQMYYARWYYMMALFIVLATVKSVDEHETVPVNWKRAFGWTAGITAALSLFVGLTPSSWDFGGKEAVEIGLFDHSVTELFWIAVSIAGACLLLTGVLLLILNRDPASFHRWAMTLTVTVSLLFGIYSITAGKVTSNFRSMFVTEKAIGGAEGIQLPQLGEGRVDFYEGMDNMGMFWKLPAIQAFHSVVPGSVMEFYPTVGVDRSVGSRPSTAHYALRGLLSVQWLFDYDNAEGWQYSKSGSKDNAFFDTSENRDHSELLMPGWSFYNKQNGFSVYKNDYYIPYGFTYQYYQTRSEYEALTTSQRELALLKAVVLEDESAAETVSRAGLLPLSSIENVIYSRSEYLSDCMDRRGTAADSFSRDNRGFTASITLESDNLVFFSVPYEAGWSAAVDGCPAEIVKANVGFMAVHCPGGKPVTIRFEYMAPGLGTGAVISGAALFLLLVYLVIMCPLRRRRKEYAAEPVPPSGQLRDFVPRTTCDGEETGFSLDEFYAPHDADE